MNMDFLVLEQGSDLGGTWYWNRYPGCRFDSESETYGYSFSKDLLQEWNWKEHYAPREETESYLHFVAAKFNLRKFMRFNSELSSAIWQENDKCWKIKTKDGSIFFTKYLLTAIGLLSCPTPPKFKGLQNFKGTSFHFLSKCFPAVFWHCKIPQSRKLPGRGSGFSRKVFLSFVAFSSPEQVLHNTMIWFLGNESDPRITGQIPKRLK